ncbi:MAG: hypothetical protein KC621_13450 [Myxococcales bacterium]|nr:hypothetical protein [Myxococcales bacterium]
MTSTTDGPPTWPVVAFGEWVTASAPSVEGLPSVRVNLFRDAASGIETFPPFLRTIVAYDQNLLPPFPNARFVWTARPGLVTLQQMQVVGGEARTRSNQPHLEQEVLAHEVAHQWWGGLVRPARSEDRWMSETMATMYACVFVGALFDPKDCEVRKSTWRDTWEKELTAFDGSVRDAQATSQWVDVAYAYGPYVTLHMLRGRIGDEAFFGALDRYARDRVDAPATTDRLQAAFEATSGKDLHDFFAWWLVGGFVPALHLTLDGTSGTLTSDIPFGTFDVPVVVVTNDGEQTLWVDVVDGTGTFTAPAGTRKVKLDPDGLVLARTRKVSRR